MSEENYNTDSSAEVQVSSDAQENQGQGSSFQDDFSQGGYREGNTNYTGTYQDSSGSYSYQGTYYQNYEEPVQESRGFGIASMVLGIISLVLFCTCCNLLLAVLAIVFGIIHLVRCKSGKGFGIAGIVTAALSIIFFFVYIFAFAGSSAFQEEFQKEVQRQFKNQMEQNFGEDYEEYYDFNFPFDNDDDSFGDYGDYDEEDEEKDHSFDEDEKPDTF